MITKVEILEILKRPFKEMKEIAIACLFAIIPIINILSLGYAAQFINGKKKTKLNEMPKIIISKKGFKQYVIDGLKVVGISLSYLIPITLITLSFIVTILGKIPIQEQFNMTTNITSQVAFEEWAATTDFTAAGKEILFAYPGQSIGAIIIGLLGFFLIKIIIPIGITLSFKKESFKKGFNFKEIQKIITKKDFILPIIIAIIGIEFIKQMITIVLGTVGFNIINYIGFIYLITFTAMYYDKNHTIIAQEIKDDNSKEKARIESKKKKK